ncbi:MAG TPA: glycosyltransferase family A protein [Thermoanaerobaculia bacterium]
MESPRLTIVIPTVNRASLVGRAVESALAQTYPSLEIIVSNNGSTDATREVLARYEGAPRLRILHRDVTIPATDHGNALIDAARGEFFLGLSDDDWLEPDFTARVMELFDRRPDLAFVWTGCMIHYGSVAMPAQTGPEIESGTDFLAAFLAGERNVCWCACVTRTSDLRRIGPIPSDVVCGDMFFWTKIAARGDVGCVEKPVSHYVCYRESSDGSAGGTPVLTWAADTERWVNDILATCESAPALPFSRQSLREYSRRFLARSTANQFVWQALRGERRVKLLRTVRPALPYLRARDRSPWIRVIAALVAPRWLLRSRMLAEARRRARAASRAA